MRYLDKIGATREATAIMSVVVPIGKAKAAAEARPERVGVLLVNLGTPDSADARGVRV
jgi:ferrochelatase